jgi:hypothetical protein
MSDLEKLIARADVEVRIKKEVTRSYGHDSSTAVRQNFSAAGWIALGVIFAVALFGISQAFMPLSAKAVKSDLNAALDAAHDTVEEYRRINDRLPERIPVTALANLVHFERRNGGYHLSTSLNGMTLSRDY